jgi:predicted enzyme related to lactoylglutathione lyase
MTAYDNGAPLWVELSSPDLEKSHAFFRGLFGWETAPAPAGGDVNYGVYTLGGSVVAGFTEMMPGLPMPLWTTYMKADDIQAACAAVTAAGGQVTMPPTAVFDVGTMAACTDPEGGGFGLWQPGTFTGMELIDEPGTVSWLELAVRDSAPAKEFYTQVFGWHGDTMAAGGITYTVWTLAADGGRFGGMIQMDDNWPEIIKAHWMVYFEVEDTDAAAAKAVELGGSVPVAPTDIPLGRFAVVSDPTGAHFSILRMNR